MAGNSAEHDSTAVTKYEPTCPNWWNLIAPELEAAQLEQKTPKQALVMHKPQ